MYCFRHRDDLGNVQPARLLGIIRIVITGHKPPRGTRSPDLRLSIETDRETDGRWIAEIPEVPGAMADGKDEREAVTGAYAIALRILADEAEKSDDDLPESISFKRRAIA